LRALAYGLTQETFFENENSVFKCLPDAPYFGFKMTEFVGDKSSKLFSHSLAYYGRRSLQFRQ